MQRAISRAGIGMGLRRYYIGGAQIPEAVVGRTGMGVRKYSFSGISGSQVNSAAGGSASGVGGTGRLDNILNDDAGMFVRKDSTILSEAAIGRMGMGAKNYDVKGSQLPAHVIGRTGMGVRKYKIRASERYE